MNNETKDTQKEHTMKMEKKQLGMAIIALVVVGAGMFYAGMQYGQKHPTTIARGGGANLTAAQRQAFGARGGGRGPGGGGGGFTAGSVVSKDDKSITVKLRSGSTQTVFYSGSTTVMKSDAGTINDVTNGSDITVSGTPNSDGSVSANSIQIGTLFGGGGAGANGTTPAASGT